MPGCHETSNERAAAQVFRAATSAADQGVGLIRMRAF
jgi:hypothetical protein